MKINDEIGLSHLYHFIFNQLKRFDLDPIKQINIEHKEEYYSEGIIYEGTCKRYEKNNINTYRIDAFINPNQEWPQEITILKEPITLTFDEAIIFVLGHELHHYLSSDGQIKAKDTETNANKYGLKWVRKYRKQK